MRLVQQATGIPWPLGADANFEACRVVCNCVCQGTRTVASQGLSVVNHQCQNIISSVVLLGCHVLHCKSSRTLARNRQSADVSRTFTSDRQTHMTQGFSAGLSYPQ
jgi:hypothetical protein